VSDSVASAADLSIATKVVIATAFGGPDVLSLVDEHVGPPAAGQVLLDVRAAGVNRFDVKSYSGAFGTDPTKLPMRLGFEAAGVVLAVGEGAVGPAGPVAVGDEVIAYPAGGAYAQRLIAPATSVVPRPSALTWEQAGGLLLTGVTAAHTVAATAVAKGDTVLIHGGAGGVGIMAVQLAKNTGARVIATASAQRHDVLRELGAEPVTYGEGLAARVRTLAPDGIDAAIDTVGTDEAVDVSLELVADRDRIATIAAFGRAGQAGIKLLGGGPGADPGTEIRDRARMELVELVAEGKLRVFVSHAFPLADATKAHEASLSGHTFGKIVLVP
jgi:NADPH:quinone reductase